MWSEDEREKFQDFLRRLDAGETVPLPAFLDPSLPKEGAK